MITQFSVARRATGLVDVLFPKQSGVVGYRLKASTNFDGTFTTILTANIGCGYLDPAVDRRKLHTMPGFDHVRAAFNPDTFTGTAGISDTSQFWLIFVPVDAASAEGTATDPVLVLAPSQHKGTATIAISGTAPNQATLAGALGIHLPHRMRDVVVRNHHDSLSMFVALNRGGGEVEIPPNTSNTWLFGAESQIYVRGVTNTVPFSATFTAAQEYT